MPNSNKLFKTDLNARGIFRGAHCGQKPAQSYFEKVGSKFLNLKVNSSEGAYKVKKWAVPSLESLNVKYPASPVQGKAKKEGKAKVSKAKVSKAKVSKAKAKAKSKKPTLPEVTE